ncbi:MAG: 5-oxoprolinase (ATP-hydrolyzing) subunit [Chloroflexota bacterium]|nr:5-oxoprolinase (ATP-hydrolyzing) subunit [Chloroflexota bacterium]
MNLNADLGEGASEDEAILAHVDSASVGCGVHAGSASITIATVSRCRALGVEVGAHPGYDDRSNFGRVEVAMSVDEVEALVAVQVGGLAALGPIAYVKPHGALYRRCQHDEAAADALARVAKQFQAGLVGQPGLEIIAAAQRAGIPGYREGFADRLMLADCTLAPRNEPGSVLDPDHAVRQAVQMANSGRYDTICIHGDSPGAGQVAAAVRRALDEAGIATASLRANAS